MEKENNEGDKTDKQLDGKMAQSTKCLQYQHGQLTVIPKSHMDMMI